MIEDTKLYQEACAARLEILKDRASNAINGKSNLAQSEKYQLLERAMECSSHLRNHVKECLFIDNDEYAAQKAYQVAQGIMNSAVKIIRVISEAQATAATERGMRQEFAEQKVTKMLQEFGAETVDDLKSQLAEIKDKLDSQLDYSLPFYETPDVVALTADDAVAASEAISADWKSKSDDATAARMRRNNMRIFKSKLPEGNA